MREVHENLGSSGKDIIPAEEPSPDNAVGI